MFLCYDLSTALRRWEQHENQREYHVDTEDPQKINKNATLKVLEILKILDIHIKNFDLTSR